MKINTKNNPCQSILPKIKGLTLLLFLHSLFHSFSGIIKFSWLVQTFKVPCVEPNCRLHYKYLVMKCLFFLALIQLLPFVFSCSAGAFWWDLISTCLIYKNIDYIEHLLSTTGTLLVGVESSPAQSVFHNILKNSRLISSLQVKTGHELRIIKR